MKGPRYVLIVAAALLLLTVSQTGHARVVFHVHNGHFNAWVSAPFWPIVLPLLCVGPGLPPYPYSPVYAGYWGGYTYGPGPYWYRIWRAPCRVRRSPRYYRRPVRRVYRPARRPIRSRTFRPRRR